MQQANFMTISPSNLNFYILWQVGELNLLWKIMLANQKLQKSYWMDTAHTVCVSTAVAKVPTKYQSKHFIDLKSYCIHSFTISWVSKKGHNFISETPEHNLLCINMCISVDWRDDDTLSHKKHFASLLSEIKFRQVTFKVTTPQT